MNNTEIFDKLKNDYKSAGDWVLIGKRKLNPFLSIFPQDYLDALKEVDFSKQNMFFIDDDEYDYKFLKEIKSDGYMYFQIFIRNKAAHKNKNVIPKSKSKNKLKLPLSPTVIGLGMMLVSVIILFVLAGEYIINFLF